MNVMEELRKRQRQVARLKGQSIGVSGGEKRRRRILAKAAARKPRPITLRDAQLARTRDANRSLWYLLFYNPLLGRRDARG